MCDKQPWYAIFDLFHKLFLKQAVEEQNHKLKVVCSIPSK